MLQRDIKLTICNNLFNCKKSRIFAVEKAK